MPYIAAEIVSLSKAILKLVQIQTFRISSVSHSSR